MMVYLAVMFASVAPLYLWESAQLKCHRLLTAQNRARVIKTVCLLASYIVMILPFLLRSTSVGADTLRYRSHFYSVDFFSNYEPGFHYLSRFLRIFTGSFEVYLMLITAVFLSLTTFVIYRTASGIYISVLSYHCLFLYALGFSAIRQFAAMALSACGLMIIINVRRSLGSILLAVAMLCLAVTFHISAAVTFVLLLPLCLKLHAKFMAIATAVSGVLFLFRNVISAVLIALLRPENLDYAAYTSKWGLSTIVFIVIMLVMNFLPGEKHLSTRQSMEARSCLDVQTGISGILFAGLLLNLFFAWIPSHFRLTQYVYLALALLLGKDDRIRGKRLYVLTAILVLYYGYMLYRDPIAIVPYRLMF